MAGSSSAMRIVAVAIAVGWELWKLAPPAPAVPEQERRDVECAYTVESPETKRRARGSPPTPVPLGPYVRLGYCAGTSAGVGAAGAADRVSGTAAGRTRPVAVPTALACAATRPISVCAVTASGVSS